MGLARSKPSDPVNATNEKPRDRKLSAATRPVVQVLPTSHQQPSTPMTSAEALQQINSIDQTNEKQLKKLFVSYSWAFRKEDVQKMARYLKTQGFDVWLDIEKMKGFIYDEMAKGIDEADLVIVFFCEHYPRPGSNSRRELEYATSSNKKLLLVQMQKNYIPEGAFKMMAGNRLWVSFHDVSDLSIEGKEICRQIHLLLEAKDYLFTKTTVQGKVTRFEHVGVPHFAGEYYSRPEDEAKIHKELVETCNKPGKGVFVIAGEGGVGKTTLMSKLLRTDGSSNSAALEETTLVLWLNCFKWKGDSVTDYDKLSFETELAEVAKLCDPPFEGSNPARIIPFFEKNGKRVLFVLDDIFNVALLQYFVNKQIDGSKLSCCAITRNPVPLKYDDISGTIRTIAKLEALTDAGIQVMLEDFHKMKGRLSTEKLSVLASFCCGLPLLASLIRSRFGRGEEDNVKRDWDGLYKALLPRLKNLHDEKLNQGDRKGENVKQLFELSINQLPEDLRACYYAFLFFEPGQSVSVKDLAIFWGNSTATVVDELKATSLVRSIDTSEQEQHLFVHQLLYEAALQKASLDFQLQASDGSNLQEIRMKLVKGEVGNGTGIREICMFEAVRQQRLSLCRRFVDIFSSENLIELCKSHSKKQEDESSSSFLHFLYHQSWPSFDLKYPKGHQFYKYGLNNSYRLIASIFAKWKKASLDANRLLEVVNERPRKGAAWKTLLDDVLEMDEEDSQQSHERFPLVRFCYRWQSVHEEKRWAIEMSSSTNPLIPLAIQGKDEELLNSISPKHENANLAELVTFLSRLGRKATLMKVCLQFGTSILHLQDKQGCTGIIRAAQNGHLEVVKFFVETDSSTTSYAKPDGGSALMSTCQNGHLEVVQFLVETSRESVSQVNQDGWTPVMFAAQNGHLAIVEFLVQIDPSTISQARTDGWTALMLASQNGYFPVAEFILKTDRSEFYRRNNNGLTAAVLAATNGYLDLVKLFVATDRSAVCKDPGSDWAAIMMPARNGHLEVVKFLFETEPSIISQRTESGWTLLMAAARSGEPEVVRFFIEAQASAVAECTRNGQSAMMLAAEFGHLDVVRLIAEAEPSTMSQTNNEGWTACMFASQKGHTEIVEFFGLHDMTAAVFQRADENGWTALLLAANEGHLTVVQKIIEIDPSTLSHANADTWTAILLAAQSGHREIVEFLAKVDKSAIQQSTENGRTAVMIAANRGCLEIVKFLFEMEPSSVLQSDNEGWTAVTLAAKSGHLQLVQFLARANRSVIFQATKTGLTVFLLLAYYGHLEVAHFILEMEPSVVSQSTNTRLTTNLTAAISADAGSKKGSVQQSQFYFEKGSTAIIFAAQKGHLEVVKLLAETDRTTVSQRDICGKTALDVARLCQHDAVADYLTVFLASQC